MHLESVRFYVGNIRMEHTDGGVSSWNAYTLIDLLADTTQQITLPLYERNVQSLSFSVGVDSTTSVSGPREGALDPLHGMYWTWNTGYIFFRVDGTSPQSLQTRNTVEYHVGGYSAPYNNIVNVVLPISIHADTITVLCDLQRFFDKPAPLRVVHTASVTDAKAAVPLLERIRGMFRVQ